MTATSQEAKCPGHTVEVSSLVVARVALTMAIERVESVARGAHFGKEEAERLQAQIEQLAEGVIAIKHKLNGLHNEIVVRKMHPGDWCTCLLEGDEDGG